MNKKILTAFFSFFFVISVSAQKKKEVKKEVKKSATKTPESVYFEVVLENFEKTEYSDKNLNFKVVKKNQNGSLQIRDQYPAPVSNSKKYLGVKIFGRQGDYFTITPTKPLKIEKSCTKINMWVYGKNFTGSLYLLLTDAEEVTHKLLLRKLNYLGWRKLSVKLPKSIVQEDKYLNQKRFIKIIKFIYEPGNSRRARPKWQYFYIDNISASVREKYSDMQSDDW